MYSWNMEIKKFRPNKFAASKKFIKKRLYDTPEWAEYRTKFIRHNPKCYLCGARASVVDHIVAHKGKKEVFWDVTNMMPMCKHHHDYITATFDRYSPPKTPEKMRFIARVREQTETFVRVKIVPAN